MYSVFYKCYVCRLKKTKKKNILVSLSLKVDCIKLIRSVISISKWSCIWCARFHSFLFCFTSEYSWQCLGSVHSKNFFSTWRKYTTFTHTNRVFIARQKNFNLEQSCFKSQKSLILVFKFFFLVSSSSNVLSYSIFSILSG